MKYTQTVVLGLILTGSFIAALVHAAVFDVEAFGTVGDGKTVDTAAINKAIDAPPDRTQRRRRRRFGPCESAAHTRHAFLHLAQC